MHAEALSVVLLSASPATTDVVRTSCSGSDGSAIPFAAAADAGAARAVAHDMEGAVFILDCEAGGKSVAANLRALADRDPIGPVIVLTRELSADLEREMVEAGATDVLSVAEVSHSTLRRAVRYALSHFAMASKLARLAPFDQISGLPTQTLFWEILGLAVRRGQRNRDFFSVLLIDFDWSGLSPDIVDQATPVLFKRFADRIKALMRASDTVAKFDKTQIVVLAESMPRVEDVQIVAAKILSDITAPTAYGDRYVSVNAAIGIAIYPTSGSTPEELLVRAGDALATSKERTTNRFAFG